MTRKRTEENIAKKVGIFLSTLHEKIIITSYATNSQIGKAATHIFRKNTRQERKIIYKIIKNDIAGIRKVIKDNNVKYNLQDNSVQNTIIVASNQQNSTINMNAATEIIAENEIDSSNSSTTVFIGNINDASCSGSVLEGAKNTLEDSQQSNSSSSFQNSQIVNNNNNKHTTQIRLRALNDTFSVLYTQPDEKHVQLHNLEKTATDSSICKGCRKLFGSRPNAIQCNMCMYWYHKKKSCVDYGLQAETLALKFKWTCSSCYKK